MSEDFSNNSICKAGINCNAETTVARFNQHTRAGEIFVEACIYPCDKLMESTFECKWVDLLDPNYSFFFKTSEFNPPHSTDPWMVSGKGIANGLVLNGQGSYFLIYATIPNRPGEIFLCICIQMNGAPSFYTIVSGKGIIIKT